MSPVGRSIVRLMDQYGWITMRDLQLIARWHNTPIGDVYWRAIGMGLTIRCPLPRLPIGVKGKDHARVHG